MPSWLGDSHLHVVLTCPIFEPYLCAFPWWACLSSGLSRDIHSWHMPSRAVAAWSARSKGCESSRTSSDPAERADKRHSVMARTFRAVAADSCWPR